MQRNKRISLAKLMDTSYTVIGKYERDEMKPSVDVAARLTKQLDTTVGYLLGENKEMDVLKEPAMLKRLNAINELPDEDKHCLLYTIDAVLRDYKARQTYS